MLGELVAPAAYSTSNPSRSVAPKREPVIDCRFSAYVRIPRALCEDRRIPAAVTNRMASINFSAEFTEASRRRRTVHISGGAGCTQGARDDSFSLNTTTGGPGKPRRSVHKAGQAVGVGRLLLDAYGVKKAQAHRQ